LRQSDEGSPRASVILTTYNHEPFIGQAIDSILAQKCDFPVEILITEDCSTDGTYEIIDRYARRDQDLIRTWRSPRNLNTNVVTNRAIAAASGEFIALLDGDDYWTDPAKLQKQVAFLEANPNLSMCFHDCAIVGRNGHAISQSAFRQGAPAPRSSFRDIARTNYIPGPSPMIRRAAAAPLPGWLDACAWGDWPLYLIAARHGAIGFMPDRMAAYRRHEGGYWTGMAAEQRFETTVMFLADLGRELPAAEARQLSRGMSYAWADTVFDQIRARDLAGLTRTLWRLPVLAVRNHRPALTAAGLWELGRRFQRRIRR
jgi:glycosyltransferase involved in cell wall biosynthesis